MTTLKNTLENKAKVLALKTIKEVQWSGETIHDTIEKALVGMNLFLRVNSGWYNPQAIKLKGIKGVFMINEDGSLNFESRIIKIDNEKYKIEYLTSEGYRNFESQYSKEINLIEA